MRLDAAELQRGSLPAGALEDRVLKRRKADKGPQPPALLAQAGALVLAQGAEAGGAVGAGALGARALNSPLALPSGSRGGGAAALSVLIPFVRRVRQAGGGAAAVWAAPEEAGGRPGCEPWVWAQGASAGASAGLLGPPLGAPGQGQGR